MHERRWFPKYFLSDLAPYRALCISTILPMFLIINSGPQMIWYFWEIGSWRYSFWISAAKTYILFSAAYVNAMRTLSLGTNPSYLDPKGLGFLCPSRTHLAFWVKYIFTSQIRLTVTFFRMGGTPCTSSRCSKSMPTFGHLLGKSVFPEGVNIFVINYQCMRDTGWNFDTILFCCLYINGFHLGYNKMSLAQYVWHPPCKVRFVCYVSWFFKLWCFT